MEKGPTELKYNLPARAEQETRSTGLKGFQDTGEYLLGLETLEILGMDLKYYKRPQLANVSEMPITLNCI